MNILSDSTIFDMQNKFRFIRYFYNMLIGVFYNNYNLIIIIWFNFKSNNRLEDYA